MSVSGGTHDEPQLLVVAGVHGLALLDAAAVVGLALHVEGDPPQLEDDVPLSLRGPGGQETTSTSTSQTRQFSNLRPQNSPAPRVVAPRGSLAARHGFVTFLFFIATSKTDGGDFPLQKYGPDRERTSC